MSETTTVETHVSSNGTAEAQTKAKPKKKVAKVKATAAAKPSANGHSDSSKERAAAKAVGLSLVQYRLLKCLSNGSEKTYRQIEAKTGYYSILTAQLREGHKGSLGDQKLVREEVADINGKDTLAFVITAKGKKLLSK